MADASPSSSPVVSPVMSRPVSLPSVAAASLSSTPQQSPSIGQHSSTFQLATPSTGASGCLDTAFKKLISGLRTRENDYCRLVLQGAEAAYADFQRRGAAGASGTPVDAGMRDDILDFSGVPYEGADDRELTPLSPSSRPPLSARAISMPAVAQSSRQRTGGTAAMPFSPALGPATSSPGAASVSSLPISDVCVYHRSSRSSSDDFSLIERTVSGLHRAAINKGNNSKKVFIGYKRVAASPPSSSRDGGPHSASHASKAASTPLHNESDSSSKPVTSVCVFFRDVPEEAPYGFTAVEKTTAGEDACLHPGSASRRPYLAVARGDGAPLTHLSLISRQHGEKLPAGWHEVKHTPTLVNVKADLNVVVVDKQSLYLCFRLDVQPVIARWKAIHREGAGAGGDAEQQQLYSSYVRLLCCLSALLYCYDQKLILFTLDVFRKLQPHHVPVGPLNLYLACICDACPVFLTYFLSPTHSALLRFLLHCFRNALPALSLDSVMKCVEACLLLRHEDKQNEISEQMLTRVLEAVAEDVSDCSRCRRQQHWPGAGTAGGGDPDDDGKDSGHSTPAAPLSPSSLNALPAAPLVSFSSSTSSLCYHCTERQYQAMLPAPEFCRELVSSLARSIAQQHSLSPEVRTYRRHHHITPAFRADIATICSQLLQLDAETERKQRRISAMMGDMGMGAGAGRAGAAAGGTATADSASARALPAAGYAKFTFNSVKVGDVVDGIKEETEEGVRKEDEGSLAAAASVPLVQAAAAGEDTNLTITMTPSKLPSENTDRTVVQTPTPTAEEAAAAAAAGHGMNGTALLFPPRSRHGSDADVENSSSSRTSADSQSEFGYPSFHEDEGRTPTPVAGGRGAGDEDDEEDEEEDVNNGVVDNAEQEAEAEREQTVRVEVMEDQNDLEPGAALPPAPTVAIPTVAINPMASPLEHAGPYPLSATSMVTPSPLIATAADFSYPSVQAEQATAEQHRVHGERKAEKALFALVLMYSKAATEPAPFGLRDSETLRRKQQALRLLLNVVHHSRSYFRLHLSSSLLLRRFVMPSLMTATVTDCMPIFRLILQLLSLLQERYQSEAMIELGAFLDLIFLSYLENAHCSVVQKVAIIEVLQLSMLKTAAQVIELYYNYDNSSKNWPIFERMVEVLSRIVEGADSSSGSTALTAAGRSAAGAGGDVPEDGDESDGVEGSLQRQALKLLVHLLHMQAQWIGVPGLSRPPDIASRSLLTVEPSSHESKQPFLAPPHSRRRPSWSSRYETQKQQAKTLQHAIKLAQTDSLKSALQYLRLSNPSASQPMEMAKFLYRNPTLDKREIGDLLSGTTDRFMRQEEYEALRKAYISLLDFTGLSLDAALRSFLCDSGFRLPGEAQKIDRLVSAFSEQYVKDNPNAVKDVDAAYSLTFALVMLNTDAHDPRLKNQKSSQIKQMTEDDFVRNLRGMNGKEDFPRPYLAAMYRAIQAQEIKWETDKPESPGPRERKDAAALRETEQRLTVRKSYEVPVRRALAYCKNQVSAVHSFLTTDDPHIVSGMYETSWYRCVTALTTRSDLAGSDVELLHICLDGIAYGATIGICLGPSMATQRQAFASQLAKIIFVEKSRDNGRVASEIAARVAKEEHLKLDWFRRLDMDSKKHPAEACLSIFTQLHQVKHSINLERQQATLKRIENDFGGEIVLVDTGRSLVKEGRLVKVSNSGTKRQAYHFMLFTDLILYASEGVRERFKVHRVVHLSLCRLEDVRSPQFPHAFRIVSPQKSFLVLADSADKKKRWLDAILSQLTEVMSKRRRYIEEARRKEQEEEQKSKPPLHQTQPHSHKQNGQTQQQPPAVVASPSPSASASSSATSSPVSPSRRDMLRVSSSMDFAQGKEGTLRRYSTFIGQSDLDLNNPRNGGGEAAATARTVSHCKLCIRPFNSIFRRKQRCKWCSDIICQDCCTQKTRLPGKGSRQQQVCDACYGALIGMVGEDVQLLTIKEESGLQPQPQPQQSQQQQQQQQHGNAAAAAPAGAAAKAALDREREKREERRRTT